MAQRTRIVIVLVWAVGLVSVDAALGQYPPGNIPPTRVPQTPEPDLADPKHARELPERLRPEILTPMGAPTPLSGSVAAGQGPSDPPTPFVSIHVSAPGNVALGNPLAYTITVENKSQAPAHHVKVTNPLTPNLQFNNADPTPDERTDKMVSWKLGTLKPGETRTIKLELAFKGDSGDSVENVARVSFEHGQKVKTVLQRPKLSVKKLSHQYGVENQPVACRLVVENNGPLDVLNVTVTESLEDGLEFEAPEPAGKKQKVWKFERVKAGGKEERTYTVIPRKAGELQSNIEASGERGVIAKEIWRINAGKPPLKVEIKGPEKVYLNYPATYQFRVVNTGSVVLDNVAVAFSLAQGMTVERATPGGQAFKDRVQWPIGRMNAGDIRTYAITVRAKMAGRIPNIVTVLWRGPEERATAETEFLGAAALQLSLRESKDPVAVGEKVTYQLIVHNRGTSPAKDVKLAAQFPIDQFAFVANESDGKQNSKQEVEIGPLLIPPGGTVTKQVVLKATRTGTAMFHVELISPDLTSGNVVKEESTTIVGQ
jgi:uncharacterized repeat protein (TIGR01451 family)